MKIEIDEARLNEIASEKISDAVSNAIGSYNVQNAISEVVGRHFADTGFGEAISEAFKEIDTNEISHALAIEIQRTTIASCELLIRSAFASVILSVRNQDYMTTEERARKTQEILAELERAR